MFTNLSLGLLILEESQLRENLITVYKSQVCRSCQWGQTLFSGEQQYKKGQWEETGTQEILYKHKNNLYYQTDRALE